jgi:hypothetical protein
MTARPILDESCRRPFIAAVALVLVMVAVLLAAGCNDEGVVQTQDIEIVKIQNDGNLAWSKTIDYGNDEEMRDIIENDDGNFIIAGGSAPRKCTQYGHRDPPWYVPDPRTSQLIGLSRSGEIMWLQNYSFNGDGGVISAFENPDHTLDAVTKNGELWHLNPDGSEILNRSINITSIDSAVKTHDGGYVIVSHHFPYDNPGSNITRLDPTGTIVWHTWFNKSEFNQISPVVELPDQGGYLFGASYYDQKIGKSQIIIVRINQNGLLQNITPVADVKHVSDDYVLRPSSRGYILRYDDEMQGTTLVKISKNGTTIDMQAYPDLSSIFIPTKDGGYLSLDFQSVISSNAETHTAIITKTDKDGILQWKNNEIKHDVSLMEKKAIETSDGGYVVMFASKKMSHFC